MIRKKWWEEKYYFVCLHIRSDYFRPNQSDYENGEENYYRVAGGKEILQ